MADVGVLVTIEGRVQGVGFRAWTVREARRLQLRGWVRNRRDGKVEALLIGAAASIDAMVAACRQGPPLAQVAFVAREDASDDGSPGFAERPTA
jgi:acylphosphatase